jgi:hypothetical protein
MAQYVFDARKYPAGTRLSDLGFWINTQGTGVDYEVFADPAYWGNYWRAVHTTLDTFMTAKDLYTDYEMLCVHLPQRSETNPWDNGANTYHGFVHHYGVTETGGNYTNLAKRIARLDDTGSIENTITQATGSLSLTKDDAPTNITTNQGVAYRIRLESNGNIFAKAWGRTWTIPAQDIVAEQEPAAWDLEGTTGLTSTPYAITTPSNHHSTDGPAVFSFLSIGTDGDTAPNTDESIILTPPTVQVTNLTGTTATVSWS